MAGRRPREYFRHGADNSDNLANERSQFIEFYHVPTDRSVRFKAFLTLYDDGFTSDWNEEDAHGRMDSIDTFKNTKRRISLGFDVVAGSAEEAIENHQKLSLLESFLYPTYDRQQGGASSINASPLFKLRFMNLIQNAGARGGGAASVAGLLGRISGFNHAPDIDAGFFDVLGPDGEPSIYPQQFNLTFEYSVLHEHPLGWRGRDPRRGGFDHFPYGDSRIGVGGALAAGGGGTTSIDDRVEAAASIEIFRNRTFTA